MTNYIESKTTDGTLIRIEVESQLKGVGFGRQTAFTDTASEITQDVYEQTLQTIQTCANGMIDTLQNLKTRPSAASIDFAIKIDAGVGAMIAKSINGAQFKVTLSWKEKEVESDKKDN